MKQMYKVFIKNTPLHIVEKKDFIPNDCLVLFEGRIDLIKSELFQLIEGGNSKLPIYIMSNNIEQTFNMLFEEFDFIEAAGGIVKRKGKYLFIKRNGFWDIPKGKLDNNELPEVGAIREIEEECGIKKPKIKKEMCVTYHTYFYKGIPTIKKTYWFALKFKGNKKVKGQKEEGITKVKWLKKTDLSKVELNTFPSILDVIKVYF